MSKKVTNFAADFNADLMGRRYSTDMAYYGIIIDILCILLHKAAGSDEVRT